MTYRLTYVYYVIQNADGVLRIYDELVPAVRAALKAVNYEQVQKNRSLMELIAGVVRYRAVIAEPELLDILVKQFNLPERSTLEFLHRSLALADDVLKMKLPFFSDHICYVHCYFDEDAEDIARSILAHPRPSQYAPITEEDARYMHLRVLDTRIEEVKEVDQMIQNNRGLRIYQFPLEMLEEHVWNTQCQRYLNPHYTHLDSNESARVKAAMDRALPRIRSAALYGYTPAEYNAIFPEVEPVFERYRTMQKPIQHAVLDQEEQDSFIRMYYSILCYVNETEHLWSGTIELQRMIDRHYMVEEALEQAFWKKRKDYLPAFIKANPDHLPESELLEAKHLFRGVSGTMYVLATDTDHVLVTDTKRIFRAIGDQYSPLPANSYYKERYCPIQVTAAVMPYHGKLIMRNFGGYLPTPLPWDIQKKLIDLFDSTDVTVQI